MFDVAEVRRIFPHTKERIYFNVASLGPLSQKAFEIHRDFDSQAMLAKIGAQRDIFDALKTIRKKGARVFGCKTSEVGYGFNTTFGLNIGAFGLPLKKGDEVLLHDVEFPANVYPWLGLASRGIKVRFIKNVNGFFSVENFKKAITSKTRVLAVSFVQFFNGFKIDVAAISEICRKHKIFFVLDSMQGAGCEYMNVNDWGVDIASAGAQKWLMSSQGSGLFYVSEAIQDKLIAPWQSWLAVDWKCDWTNLNDYAKAIPKAAQRFELGTYPSAYVLSLDWTLNFMTELGIRNIMKHNHGLIDLLIDYLRGEPYYRITSSLEEKHRSSIFTFTTDRTEIRNVHRHLLKKNIVTALREGSIRVSVHFYNDRSDINSLIDALKEAAVRFR